VSVCIAEALAAAGHAWIGTDISGDMITVALTRGIEGDALLSDMGQSLPFRTGSFDGAISVSAVQWLCYATQRSHNPKKRCLAFFTSLYRCLKRGARAALQVYPESTSHLELLTTAAARCGFTGGLVVDFPNSTKAKKYFLCLIAGHMPKARTFTRGASSAVSSEAPRVIDVDTADDDDVEDGFSASGLEHSEAALEATDGLGGALTSQGMVVALGKRSSREFGERRRHTAAKRLAEGQSSRRAWIQRKKEKRLAKGLPTKPDSKYTGRRRPDRIT
jgi:hypothetical protein